MADTKLSDLSAGAATAATDLYYSVQSAGSGGVKSTAAQVKTFMSASPTITGHATIEGVTATGATGTGKFVFDASPTISGHITVEGVTATGATGTGKFVFDGTPTLVTPVLGVATGTSLALGGATLGANVLALTGHVLIEGVTSTGATGTGKFVFDASPTITGHPVIEGVTSTGATGTGKFVFDGTPTLVTPVLGVATATSVTANAFIANSSNVNAQTTTSYTLASTDNGKVVTFNTSSAVTTTYTSSLGAGFACTLVQLGAGQVTVTSSGTTLNARVGKKLVGQYSVASLYAYVADTAILGGDLSA